MRTLRSILDPDFDSGESLKEIKDAWLEVKVVVNEITKNVKYDKSVSDNNKRSEWGDDFIHPPKAIFVNKDNKGNQMYTQPNRSIIRALHHLQGVDKEHIITIGPGRYKEMSKNLPYNDGCFVWYSWEYHLAGHDDLKEIVIDDPKTKQCIRMMWGPYGHPMETHVSYSNGKKETSVGYSRAKEYAAKIYKLPQMHSYFNLECLYVPRAFFDIVRKCIKNLPISKYGNYR